MVFYLKNAFLVYFSALIDRLWVCKSDQYSKNCLDIAISDPASSMPIVTSEQVNGEGIGGSGGDNRGKLHRLCFISCIVHFSIYSFSMHIRLVRMSFAFKITVIPMEAELINQNLVWNQ